MAAAVPIWYLPTAALWIGDRVAGVGVAAIGIIGVGLVGAALDEFGPRFGGSR